MNTHIIGHDALASVKLYVAGAENLPAHTRTDAAAQIISDQLEAAISAHWKPCANLTFWRFCGVRKPLIPVAGLPHRCMDHVRILKHLVTGDVIMVAEPYGVSTEDIVELEAFCKARDMQMLITGATVHYPNRTIGLVLYSNKTILRGLLYWWSASPIR